MKVLFLLDSLVPAGAETSTVLLARHLQAAGTQCTVGTLKPAEGPLAGSLAAAGVRHELLDNHGSRPANIRAVRALVRRESPDIVHTCVFEADLAGRVGARLSHTPVVSTLANVAYERDEATAPGVTANRLRLARVADAATARLVSRFHAVSRTVATEMQRKLLLRRDLIEVVPRGRSRDDLGRWTAARRRDTRTRLGMGEEVPLVLAVARHEPQKGLDVLLRAIARTESPVRLVVAGREGRSTVHLHHLTRSLRLEERVTFLGPRHDVPDLLVAADVFALPSRWEGAAGAMLEAMALRCPVVATDLATLRETADDLAVRYIRPDDVGAMAEALAEALANREAAHVRAREAEAIFDARFEMPAVARQMLALYERALS